MYKIRDLRPVSRVPVLISWTTGKMSQTTNALVLGNNSGFEVTQEIYDATNIITDNFTYAKVSNDDRPTSFYVVYTVENYSPNDESGTSYLVPPDAVSGSSNAIHTSGSIRSAQGFDITNPGLVLFEHANYKGNGRIFINSSKDVNASFPVHQAGGASSAVITGGKWRLFTKKNMQGSHIDLPHGSSLVPTFVPLGINDQVQSIERLH